MQPSPTATASGDGSEAARRPSRPLTALLLLAVVLVSAALRIQVGERDPNFAAGPAEGLLKSDPALLVYLAERVADAEGPLPADWRREPRVQHPGTTDVPAELTVGQELLVGWLARLFPGVPIARLALRLMALLASLGALGAYLLASAWSGEHGPRARRAGLCGALLWALLPSDARTIGFVMVREDLAFPLFALHLGLLARAARSPRGALLHGLSGLALAGALATWHAAGFLLALELGVLLAWSLREGRNPLAPAAPGRALPGTWLALLFPLVASLAVPAPRAAGLAFSAATLPAWALAGAALVDAAVLRLGRRPRPRASLLAVLLAGGAGLLIAWRGGEESYAHVREVLLAKLRHGGRFPSQDPASISFDARLLWQGPFATLDVRRFAAAHAWPLAVSAAALAAGAWAWLRRAPAEPGAADARRSAALSAAGLAVALGAAWLFERLQIAAGLLLAAAVPAFLARSAARVSPRGARLLGAGALLLLLAQGASFAEGLRRYVNPWYVPAVRQRELAALVGWARERLGPGDPVLADFMTSPALLLHAGTPIVLQPKYETARSRRRAEAFLATFFHGTAEELRVLARERFDARILAVDRYTLWELSRTTAGLPLATPAPFPGTAAALLLSRDEEVLRSIPGYTLLYRSSPDLRGADGEPSDFYRVFRLD